MPLSEADTRAKLIDPAIHARGWSEDMICRETTLGTVEIIAGKARRRSAGRSDYTLRVRVSSESQPVAVALIEAKKEELPTGHGLDQAKGYQAASRHNVQFVFSSNGHLFVEYDRSTGLTTAPRPLAAFPSPSDLRARYEKIMGFSLGASAAKPLLEPYAGGELTKARPRGEPAIADAEGRMSSILKEAREAANKAQDVEHAVCDLKAVNPNRKTEIDRRTPAALLDLIEAKGREVAEALSALRALTVAREPGVKSASACPKNSSRRLALTAPPSNRSASRTGADSGLPVSSWRCSGTRATRASNRR